MKLRLRSISKRYRRLLGLIVLIAALGAAQPYVWNLVSTRATVLQQERSQEQQIKNVQERNQAINDKLREQQDLISQVDVVMPPRASLTQVVERLEFLADQRSLPLSIQKIDEIANNAAASGVETLGPVIVSVSVAGGVDALLGFLEEVEHTQELTVITGWSLAPAVADSRAAPAVTAPSPTPYQLLMDVMFFLRLPANG